MTDLKPCPFCGSTDIAEEDCSTMQTNGTRLACNECGAQVEGYGASTCTANAVAKWNKRADATIAQSRDELAGLLNKICDKLGACKKYAEMADGLDGSLPITARVEQAIALIDDLDGYSLGMASVMDQNDELVGLLREALPGLRYLNALPGEHGQDGGLVDRIDAALAKALG